MIEYKDIVFKIPHESVTYEEDSAYVVTKIMTILNHRKMQRDNKIVMNTNLNLGLPLENINKIAGPMVEAWAFEVFSGIRDVQNNEYNLIHVEAQQRLGMADLVLQFRKNDAVLTGSVDVKSTAEDIANSGKSPNITSYSRIRTAYVVDPDYMFIIISIKHKVYSEKNHETGLFDSIMEVVDFQAYDLKFISNSDIHYNPALGTGQIQIQDIHYVTYEKRTTWEFCQLLDAKYLNSSRRTNVNNLMDSKKIHIKSGYERFFENST